MRCAVAALDPLDSAQGSLCGVRNSFFVDLTEAVARKEMICCLVISTMLHRVTAGLRSNVVLAPVTLAHAHLDV